jgi:hypothetical protein
VDPLQRGQLRYVLVDARCLYWSVPCLEGLEGFLGFFVELGGSLVLVPSTRYLVDNVRGVAERGDIAESFLGGELETANQSLVLGFVGAAHGSHFLGDCGQHRATIGFLENDPDGALRLALFVGPCASVDEQQVVALLEVIDYEERLNVDITSPRSLATCTSRAAPGSLSRDAAYEVAASVEASLLRALIRADPARTWRSRT